MGGHDVVSFDEYVLDVCVNANKQVQDVDVRVSGFLLNGSGV